MDDPHIDLDELARRLGHEPAQQEIRDAMEYGMPEVVPEKGKRGRKGKPRPQPLPSARPFPVHALPPVASDYTAPAAEAIGCDPSYIALPLLCCLAPAIGNNRVIRLKQSWTEPAVLWAAIVGKSGTAKTPALSAATQFLLARQQHSLAEHKEELDRHALNQKVYDRNLSEWKRKKGSNEPPPWEPDEPACQRYLTTDCTIEALSSLLACQPDGLLVVRDELVGWLGGMGEYKSGANGSDLGHWLAMWSAKPLTVDRKTGTKTLHIPRAAVSLVGGIQPRVLEAAVAREHMTDGLCARLLLAAPEPRVIKWTEAIIPPEAEVAVERVFARLLALEPAADAAGNPQPYPLGLTPEAKQTWIAYYDQHRAEQTRLEDDLAAAWAKLEAYTARLALIIQLVSWAADCADGDHVDQASMESAIELSQWFAIEAERVYGTFWEHEADRELRQLIELIHQHGGRITPRALARASRRYRASGAAEQALEELARYDPPYGNWDVIRTATKQRREFVLLPE